MRCQTPAAGDRAPNLSIEPAKQQTMTRPIASERRRKRKIYIRKYTYCDGGSPLRFASKKLHVREQKTIQNSHHAKCVFVLLHTLVI